MQIKFSPDANDDFAFFASTGQKQIIKKILALLESIQNSPYDRIGKPEPLKYALSGMWSRRINSEHRLVYRIYNNHIEVMRLRGHYK
jgi:toxin YoeB